MKRKLVKQGSSTMMISLPSKWIKANNLEKGSEVELEEKNNQLTIGTEVLGKREITIEANQENKNDARNILTHLYRRGYDQITLKGFKDSLKIIRQVTSNLLLGFELTDISQSSITIENISEPTEQKYDVILKKIFQIVEETQKTVRESFEINKFSSFEDIQDLRNQQDRFIFFCRRLLIRHNTGKNIPIHWELLTFLMHIEHAYFYLYKYCSEKKIEKNKAILEMIKETENYFKFYQEAYFSKNISLIHKTINIRDEVYLGKCSDLLEKSKGKYSVILSYIKEILRLIQVGSSPILAELLEV